MAIEQSLKIVNFVFLLHLKKWDYTTKNKKKYLGNIWQQIVGANQDMSRKCALWCFLMRI